MLAPRDKKTKEEMLSEEGPVIKFDDNGRKMFIFNPYYKGKDPMKDEMWRVNNADGTWGFIRNPFAPGGEYGYDATTYEKFQQKGFFQPEVDPWF